MLPIKQLQGSFAKLESGTEDMAQFDEKEMRNVDSEIDWAFAFFSLEEFGQHCKTEYYYAMFVMYSSKGLNQCPLFS